MNNCYHCGYHKEENGQIYCADRDCYVDPFEPDCND